MINLVPWKIKSTNVTNLNTVNYFDFFYRWLRFIPYPLKIIKNQ